MTPMMMPKQEMVDAGVALFETSSVKTIPHYALNDKVIASQRGLHVRGDAARTVLIELCECPRHYLDPRYCHDPLYLPRKQ